MVSREREAWKMAIAAAVGTQASSRNTGPIELALRFTVLPRRSWVALWKPAIDALGGILSEGGRRWRPRDDGIALLVLKRELSDDVGWGIELDMWWTEPFAGKER